MMSRWYADFEREVKSHTMWTMLFMYYCISWGRVLDGQLYTVYNTFTAAATSASTGPALQQAADRQQLAAKAAAHVATGVCELQSDSAGVQLRR